MKTTVKNYIMGGRRRLTLPEEFCRELDLRKDDFITISLEDGAIIIRPAVLHTDNSLFDDYYDELDYEDNDESINEILGAYQ